MVDRLRIDDRGAIEGFVLIAAFSLALLTLVVALVASVLMHHERTRTAADFAALAAAQTQECAAAAEAAKRNGAALRSCTIDEVGARIEVSVPTRFGSLLTRLGAPTEFFATAHASM